MLIAGHTMGTPEYTIAEALSLFGTIGLDGAEIVVQDDYKCGIPRRADKSFLNTIKSAASSEGLHIACLTPYNCHFNSADRKLREQDIEDIKHVISFAGFLNAGYIRLYAGTAVHPQDFSPDNYRRIIESMNVLGDIAGQYGVTLVLENHFNTMTVSAQDTVSLAQKIGHPAVRILYDQANLTFTGKEDFNTAIDVQGSRTAYVHVKDLIFKSNASSSGGRASAKDVTHQEESERIVTTRIVGEGILPWQEILRKLKSSGYDGWLSLEYERRWHPLDIPDASVGMKKSAEFIQNCLNEI